MDHKLVVGLSSTGLLMGLVTSLVGLPANVEALAWLACYVVWVVITERRGCERPFAHILAASLLTGVVATIVQLTLLESYLAANPDYAHRLLGLEWREVAAAFFAQGLAAALVTGVIVGGIATLRARRHDDAPPRS